MERGLFATVSQFILLALVILTPLFFLPITNNMFFVSKQLLVLVAVSVLLLLFALNLLTRKHIVLPFNPVVFPLIIFSLVIILNMAIFPEGRTEGLVNRGGIYLLGAIIALLTTFIKSDHKLKERLLYAIIFSSGLLALHSTLQLTFFHSLTSLPSYMQSRSFSLAGSALHSLVLIILGLAANFSLLSSSRKTALSQAIFLVTGIFQIIAIVAYASLMLPGRELALNLLPYQAAWSLSLDALKSVKQLLLGVGLGNFSSLYTSAKPLYLNSTQFWSVIPSNSSSELLHLLSTTGLIGLISFLAIVWTAKGGNHNITSVDRTLRLLLYLSLLALLLTPLSVSTLLVFVLSASLLASHDKSINLSSARIFIAVFALTVTALLAYYGVRHYLSEFYLHKARGAIVANDSRGVFENTLRAVNLSPTYAEHRISYSQVNLTLASSLSQKSELTESDREQINGLVAQAIREAKVATNLRPSDSRTWINLGTVYRNLVNVANGAGDFAVESYAKAVSLDPGNPALRVEYGGLLQQLAKSMTDKQSSNNVLSRSIQEFQIAIQLKPDYANAHYNLSHALELAGNIEEAYKAMQKAVASIAPDSPDLENATRELEVLRSKLPAPTTENRESITPATSGELDLPSPLPSPLEGGPIDIEG